VADVVCGRFRLWPIWSWPIWFVADIVVIPVLAMIDSVRQTARPSVTRWYHTKTTPAKIMRSYTEGAMADEVRERKKRKK